MTDITIQAADDAAILALLTQHNLLVIGEGSVTPAPGVAYSHIGEGTVDGVPLSGRYAWVGLNPDVLGQPAVDSLLLNLQPHLYTGPDLRMRLGGSNWKPGGVPQAVTMRQARLALLGAGVLDLVQAAIDALPEPAKSAAQITWEYSTEVHRHNGLVSQLAPALGMTEAQIDTLFITAAAL
jgi:hypothetical protein